MPRLSRKNEHIYYSVKREPRRADFSDISFVHNCLANRDFREISLTSYYMGRSFRTPLFINALTGGTRIAYKINAALAEVAKKTGLPMAVGSQMAGLEDSLAEESYKIVRRLNPGGIIWANIGSYADEEMARKAVKMVIADGIQVHLNIPQELIMSEGEVNFQGMIDRIRQIASAIEVPVIVKEVGFGIAGEQAEELARCKISAIDVGGRGGTNFLNIESIRSGRVVSRSLRQWGIPTAISLIESSSAVGNKVDVFASGGLYSSIDIAKALSLGARAVGMAGMPLYLLLKKGRKALEKYIYGLERELSIIMMMTGASSVEDLRQVPLVITGYTAEWMQRRGLDPSVYARRQGLAK